MGCGTPGEALRGVAVLVPVDVGPDRVGYLDDLWPELSTLLSQSRPAGSSRDVFLHVHAEHVLEGLHGRTCRTRGGAVSSL